MCTLIQFTIDISLLYPQVVKPGDWTTFDVVFLARAIGAVHSTIYVHTSLGTFDYKVGWHSLKGHMISCDTDT